MASDQEIIAKIDGEIDELLEIFTGVGASTAFRLIRMLGELRHHAALRAIIGSQDAQEQCATAIARSTRIAISRGDDETSEQTSARLDALLKEILEICPPLVTAPRKETAQA